LRVALSVCVCYLQNGSTYGGEIWHADACHPCARPLWGLMSIGVIIGKKINISFKFSNVNKLAVNSFGFQTVGRLAVQRTVLRPSRPAAESMAQLGYGVSHIPIHYADKARDGVRSTIGMRHSNQNQA